MHLNEKVYETLLHIQFAWFAQSNIKACIDCKTKIKDVGGGFQN